MECESSSEGGGNLSSQLKLHFFSSLRSAFQSFVFISRHLCLNRFVGADLFKDLFVVMASETISARLLKDW